MNRFPCGGLTVLFRYTVAHAVVLVTLTTIPVISFSQPPSLTVEPGFFVKVRDIVKSGRSDPRSNIRSFLSRGHIGSIPATIDGARFHSPSVMSDRIEEATQPPVGIPAPRPECTAITVAAMEPFIPLRNPDNRISMRDEMVAVRDFDYGRFRAMIVKDHARPFGIKGFVRIPAVWGIRFAPPEDIRRAPIMLAEALNRYTGIEARPDGHLRLTDRRLFSTPFLYITTADAFKLTRGEMECLGGYLRSGGFAFMEDGDPRYESGPGGVSLKLMIRDALGSRARIQPIPTNHPLYHCLFGFTDGPPQGIGGMYMGGQTVFDCGSYIHLLNLISSAHYLEGVFIDDRLVAVYSDQGYGLKWAPDIKGDVHSSPQMKFAANLLVYALTREGGMTGGIMDGFGDTW